MCLGHIFLTQGSLPPATFTATTLFLPCLLFHVARRKRGWCSLPQFPPSSGLRPSSLFPGQAAGVQLSKENRAFNSGSPLLFSRAELWWAVRTRFRTIAFHQAHCFTAANISSALLQDVHLANPSRPPGSALGQLKRRAGATDDRSKSELTIKISLETAAK